MKTLLIEGRYKGEVKLTDSVIKKLPSKVGLATSIQFVDHLPKIKEQLKGHGVEAYIEKGLQPYPGQVLGCDVSAATQLSEKVDAYLCISSGEFHPLGIALKTDKPVYVYNPVTHKHNQISKEEIDTFKKRKKGAYLKFLHSTH